MSSATSVAELAALLDPLRVLAEEAGRAAMVHYDEPDTVAKADGSPLTRADMASHHVLVDGLGAIFDVPVLSEESVDEVGDERLGWGRFWLVDPLDGTKEFVKRNGDFTVNVALIEDGRPVLGVVVAPALGLAYWGVPGHGAWCDDAAGVRAVAVAGDPEAGEPVRVVASRSHRDPEVDAFLGRIGRHECHSRGSSLKLCLVAEGSAHLYPRFGPTCEWDTAAAHAVVRAAGGRVTDLDGAELRYGKGEVLNPFFVADGTRTMDWRAAIDADLRSEVGRG